MAWFLPRHVITIAYVTSGIERRARVSVWLLLAAFAIVTGLPLLIAFAVAWKANGDVQELHARHRALEIETANYRSAVDALLGQIGLQQLSIPDQGGQVAGSSEPARLDRLTGAPVARRLPAALAPATPAAAQAALVPAAGAPVPPATGSGDPGADTEAAVRAAFIETRDVRQMPASAGSAETPAVASPSDRAGAALEVQAQERPSATSVSDALVRPVEADGSLRAVEVGARAQTAVQERSDGGDEPSAPVRPSFAEREAPAQAADSQRADSRVPSTAPVQTETDVEDTLREVIARYVSGLESRNMAALKRVWPTLGGSQERAIQTEFENARTVQTLFTDPRITIKGDTTTVTGFRTYTLVTHDGQRLSRVTRTTMTLRRVGDGWVIERVEHQQ